MFPNAIQTPIEVYSPFLALFEEKLNDDVEAVFVLNAFKLGSELQKFCIAFDDVNDKV